MRETHIDKVDLNLLPPLMALLEERHVSRAAERARLSQPAMSRAMQRLRRHFGDELLVRGPDGYSLTPRAERIRDQLATTVTQLEQLFANESFDPATAAQSFRMAITDYALSAFGPAVVHSILAQSPASTVHCEALDSRAFDKLDAGTLDLVIYGRAVPDRYCSTQFFTDQFVCVVAADHPLAAETAVSLSAYLRWPHVDIALDQPWIERALEAHDAKRRIAVRMPYFAPGPNMLPGTELILTVPAQLARAIADPAQTRVLTAPPELGELRSAAVWHPRLDQDPSHRWLRQVVSAIATASASRPGG
ncbi:LysR family transcriptional regulator [Mycobacterium sp. E3247]|uniref:LysR family transcriptional regulator n=1 Tax=Mycobacterium sp. E3247 TaxID=1856864 RepID=UPI0007FFC803|nr:LysR family transcriptional regulator [Mycobacterium sp. E3247]OBH14322.1 LysR family transcriptional regulator [Mycobacterium sp. E3247]